MVTLILEMFDSGGNFVPCNNAPGLSTLGDQPGDPPLPGNFGFIFPQVGGPPNAFDFAPPPNITDHGRLIFRVQVNNNVCDAELPKVATAINSTDTDPLRNPAVHQPRRQCGALLRRLSPTELPRLGPDNFPGDHRRGGQHSTAGSSGHQHQLRLTGLAGDLQ